MSIALETDAGVGIVQDTLMRVLGGCACWEQSIRWTGRSSPDSLLALQPTSRLAWERYSRGLTVELEVGDRVDHAW
ncbi:hypothetical protein GCM10023198_34620 [Promicromonospora umidemergens]|uniref:Uncharacterized protein n=1 Tax=Promicromonospora umidemergens TaxID=629679 RepID=A0ABP8XL15_9MICO